MSRGLGSLQRDIKEVLAKTVDDCGPLGIADLRQWLIARAGGGREDALRPARERSLRRAIKGLVDRGEILPAAMAGLAIRAATPPSNVSLALPGRL